MLNLGRMQGGDLEYLGPLHAGYGWHKEQCILAALKFGDTRLCELPRQRALFCMPHKRMKQQWESRIDVVTFWLMMAHELEMSRARVVPLEQGWKLPGMLCTLLFNAALA